MKKTQNGFSLIEIMILLSIVSILAAIAIPAYKDHITKVRMANVVSATTPIKAAMTKCLETKGAIYKCDDATKLGITIPEENRDIASISIEPGTGIITATAKASIGGYSYILTPIMSNPSGSSVNFSVESTCPTYICKPQFSEYKKALKGALFAH